MKNNVNLEDCLGYIRDARAKGLTAPVILMGYLNLNPFLAYGLDKLMREAQEAGERACIRDVLIRAPVPGSRSFLKNHTRFAQIILFRVFCAGPW